METNVLPPWNVYDKNCPTRLVLDRIADKWTVLIIGRLSAGTRRFGELKREISGITQKVLSQTLKDMERDGIVTRQVYATMPPKVEYSLTPLGYTLICIINSIRGWAETNIELVLVAQKEYDDRNKRGLPEMKCKP
jgi:DNA-binding HxlR family transcriptional regulator